MSKLKDMLAERESIRSKLAELAAIEDPSDDDVIFQDEMIARHKELDPEIEKIQTRMAALKEITRAAEVDENREEPADKPEAPAAMFVRSGIDKDPFKGVTTDELIYNRLNGKELRARSAALVEMDENRHEISRDHAEVAYARAQSIGTETAVSRHILLTGTDEYREAFRSFMSNPLDSRQYEGQLFADLSAQGVREISYRAVNLTNASGGFLLPYVLDPTIVLTNNASANPFRRISRIVQTTSNAWQGVNSAGVTAQMIGEAVTAGDMSPTVGQIQITPLKAVAWVLGSYEALDDTNFGEQLPGLLSDAKDRLESGKFTTGSGTNDILGIMPALGSSNRVAPGTTGTAFTPGTGAGNGALDVLNLQGALAPRFRQSPGAAYLGNIAVLNRVRGVDVYGGSQFWTNLTTNTPPSLLGQPVYEGSDMNAVTTGTSAASGTASATLLYGDFNQFIIADRVGVSMLYDPMLKGTGNAQLPTGQAGWYMFWRYGSGISTTAAFRYLTIS